MHSRELARLVERYDFRVKLALLVVSILTLLLLAIAAYRDNFAAPWRAYQIAYREVLESKARDDADRDFARGYPIELRQLVVNELGAVDRCISCHVGIDDPRMVDEANPFRAHPGRLLEIHEPARFGCTSCHGGQGRATEVASAHGRVPHWEAPLVEKRYLPAMCGACHSEGDLYGGDQDFYARAGVSEDVKQSELRRAAPGGDLVSEGKELVSQRGCLGCHAYRGKGGSLGPDLTGVGDKTRHDFDFTRFGRDEPRTVERWLTKHFVEPQEISPGTLMPPLGLDAHGTSALTAYMLSLKRRSAPASHRPVPDLLDRAPADGAALFGLFCSSCHGSDGTESEVPGLRTPALNNVDFLAAVGDDYLRAIISQGRSGTKMPAWSQSGGNLTRGEIDRLVEHVRSWEPTGADPRIISASRGDESRGQRLFHGNCAGCHGVRGEGGIGNALASPSFLAVASDAFLAHSIVEGRPGTAMTSWKHLPAEDVSDLLAFLRSWQRSDLPETSGTPEAPSSRSPEAVLAIGALTYRANCAACHGDEGEGGLGVTLRSPEFLRRVDDEYLHDAIVHGRPGTAMPAWRHLRREQVDGLVAYLKSWQIGDDIPDAGELARGDPTLGEVTFRQACSGCHGSEGQGGAGPQIANPAFLRSASDAQLFAWIAHGKTGTAMKGFLPEAQGVVSLSEGSIRDVIAYLRHRALDSRELPVWTGVGDPVLGGELFVGNCASCHGPDGEGASGPQLNNAAFLDAASDGFLIATIVLGRTGTAMRSMVHGQEGLGQIAPEEIEDVVAYLRQWSSPRSWRVPRPAVEMTDDAIASGRRSFEGLCASCHGPNGRGVADGPEYFAPALKNPEFLRAASDGLLLATIARGRAGTPMRPFGIGAGGIAEISADEINDIVSYLRSWQSSPPAQGALALGARTEPPNPASRADQGDLRP